MSAIRKIAVFASGYGSNFEAIARAAQSGEIPAEVVLLVCDKKSARACDIANELGIESFIFTAKEYNSKQEYESAIVEQCKAKGVEMICLAGYMRIVGEVLLRAYPQRIINLHPSLLPSFKGADAIRQAFEFGVKVYGATIPIVTATGEAYDRLHAVVRMLAHFTEYALLGVLAGWCYRSYTDKSVWLLAPSIGVALLATLDECLQLTAAGRGAQFFDVMMDILGGCIGLAFALLTVWLALKMIAKRRAYETR